MPTTIRAFALLSTTFVLACGPWEPVDEIPSSDAGGEEVTDDETGLRIFTTSIAYDGNLRAAGGGATGTAGADLLCQQHADGAGLGGTWAAWLSTDGNAARDRITASGPWTAVFRDGFEGTKIFNNPTNLRTVPLSSIDRDEFGQLIPYDSLEVWTGTVSGGTAGSNCANFTSTNRFATGVYGSSWASDSRWTEAGDGACDARRRLYCLQLR